MTSAQFPVSDDARQCYEILLALRVADNHQRLYIKAQEEGLLNLVREHVPMVLVSRFPENQLIARAFEAAKQAGGAA